MKVYLPVIIGYVPDDIIKCLRMFLEACYITRRQDIDINALDHLDDVLEQFKELWEVFRVPNVREKGFALPRMQSMFHYCRQIEDFGAPGGLCLSITESRHITAVNKPYHRLNMYEALGQMLITNQWLNKLAAMCSDFSARGMDSFLHGTHLIPVFGDHELPLDLHFTDSLHAFEGYYVNKYIDHHAHEIIF